MSRSRSYVQVLTIAATVAILGGCSTGGANLAPNTSAFMQPRLGIDASAKATALLYISDDGQFSSGSYNVYVYSYPQGKLRQTLTGFSQPEGMCTDKAGNVWISNAATSQLFEYAHGGSSPIATLNDSGEYPVGCSVDAKTGNLAVANTYAVSGGPGTVSIFAKAAGNPKIIAAFYRTHSVGYDDKGNLFVDGRGSSSSGSPFIFGELGGGKVKVIKLKGGTINLPGGIQWDGKYITVGDRAPATIYRISAGKIISSTPLTGEANTAQYAINGKIVVAPDAGSTYVGFFKYPAGGSPTKTISGFSLPLGVAISP